MNYSLQHIDTLLIANRGEIACRIMRTAKALGLKTVAVYTPADAAAAHIQLADFAVELADTQTDTGHISGYLNSDAIIAAAKKTGAQAIHPGYGFLSENADFARAIAQADLRFVGPEASAIESLGDKVAAKAFANKLGISTLPTLTFDPTQSPESQTLPTEGWPWLIKAAAGGGGRGMRVVSDGDALRQVLGQAQAEAQQHFGNPTVFLERYLPRVRHIEVQIFADHTGQVHHLWHRDCTAQRRHQKVIEEAPAAELPEKTSTEILQASEALAKAANYLGAGTVEFLVDPEGNWYFLEMNTRLQVEHPATEAITGEDLVAWQLLVADGQALPSRQQSHPYGHAIELRICAENPTQQFMPTTGTITQLRWPSGPHIRIDHALFEGLTITPNFDSLLAKLIVWGSTRKQAIKRLQVALSETFIEGITTNLSFHRHFVGTDAFRTMDFHTTTLSGLTLPAPNTVTQAELYQFLAAASAIAYQQPTAPIKTQITANSDAAPSDAAASSSVTSNPWASLNSWRHQGHRESCIFWHIPKSTEVTDAAQDTDALFQVSVKQDFEPGHTVSGNALNVSIIKRSHAATLTTRAEASQQTHHLSMHTSFTRDSVGAQNTIACFFINGATQKKMCFQWTQDADGLTLQTPTHRFTLAKWHSGLFESDTAEHTPGEISAQVPGVVKQIMVKAGDQVNADTVLMIIESMKIEQEITAKQTGVIDTIYIAEGDRVEGQQPLLKLQEDEGKNT